MEAALTILAMLPVLAGAPADPRQAPPRTTDTPVSDWSRFTSESFRTTGRRAVRERVLAAAGLLPLPPRRLMHPRIFGRLEREGYAVEKVILETTPGFFLGGNLYRPLQSAPRSRPAVLTPHGHWARGRLHHDDRGSIPGRCINLARQGYVVFAYDMVGYNDTGVAISHRFAQGDARAMLWSVTLGGLQTWNSIRALDFLAGLPEVDPRRIGVTGASGGGTQTFLLAAVDDRPAAWAPVNMISAHFQGGCLCENLPGLRVGSAAHNLEIGAMAAPKPMLMVSCTGDWTKNTPALEGPTVRRAWELYGVPERLQWVQFEAEHNYNRDSREAVYAFFGQWLLGESDASKLREQPFEVEAEEDLLAFAGGRPPAGALTEPQLIEALIAERRAQFQTMLPHDAASLRLFRETYGRALACALAIEPVGAVQASRTGSELVLTGPSGERVAARVTEPAAAAAGITTVAGGGAELAASLARQGQRVVSVEPFRFQPERDRMAAFFTTYNRTELACRVQDLLLAVAWARAQGGPVSLVGAGDQGPVALLAAPFAAGLDRLAAELGGLGYEAGERYLADLWQPGLLRAGGLETAAILSAARETHLSGADGLLAAPIELAAKLEGRSLTL